MTKIPHLRPLLLALLVLTSVVAASAWAGEAVHVENASTPTQCAEDDNVYVKLEGQAIRHFEIEARHPAYAAEIGDDNSAADFTNCDQSHHKSYAFAPKDVMLYEDRNYQLVGHTYAGFWRPESVAFRVGGTVTPGLHLVQLIRKIGGRRIEILVLYPSDGYWRAKPLPPEDGADTAYGSSFLIGPIEEDGRPLVRLSWVEFDPRRLEFRLGLKTGMGSLRVTSASLAGTRLLVTLPASAGSEPFAAIRSMFVAPDDADTAEIVPGPDVPSIPIMDFKAADATAVLFARSRPSRHNTSAPDLSFSSFVR